jgi:hypothetical protein
MKRLSTARLLEVGAGLSPSERVLIEQLGRLRLVSHGQAAVLLGHDHSVSGARLARRTLRRLTELGVLARLERRIGGLRAGSAGHVYYLGPAGQRIVGYWHGQGLTRGRYRPEPGGRFVRHRLAVSELYVQAIQAERDGFLDVLAFDPEPDCWRTYPDGFGSRTLLKPDAFVRIGLGAYDYRYLVEIDLATESRPVIARKLRAYLAYFKSGVEQEAEGVFPRVLLLTSTEERRAVLVDLCARLPAEDWDLFIVTTLDAALEVLGGEFDQPTREAR